MKFLLSSLILFFISSFSYSSVIDNYLNSQPEKSMVCWEENKWVKYELRGDKLLLGGLFELPILENKGDCILQSKIPNKGVIFTVSSLLVNFCYYENGLS